ncbi:Protein rigor mortis [Eumeta japonica]|uniref:Protein rigor mortis n=1 Tax=Eumeta variegata TaxID=151549 RepID=A0A4C1T5W2_EUMVA|nr:Protein rigor mortis [Eumeta japonica]
MLELDKPKTGRKLQQKPVKLQRSDVTIDADEMFDIYDYEYLESEFGAASQGTNMKNDFVSDFVGIEKPNELIATANFDFAEACQSLKEEINALRDEKPQTSPECMISLDECVQAAKNRNDLSSCGSEENVDVDGKNQDVLSDKESSNGSLVRLACRTPSSESVDLDGMQRNPQQNIICQADVHCIEQPQHNNASQLDEEPMQNDLIDDDDKILADSESCLSENEAKEKNAENSMPQEIFDVLLASCSADGSFCVWNAKTGATCDTHKIRSSHAGKSQ